MGFRKGLSRILSISLIVGAGFVPAAAGLAQSRVKAPAPTPAVERGPSNVDLVNKALKPGASDPDVPLPRPDLARSLAERPASSALPQVYGRQEEGGAVLGFRVPIPADRSASGGSARY